jgi:hypothetical protein
MITLVLLSSMTLQARSEDKFFDDSYALVVGIGQYADNHWPNLAYAKKDAQGVAEFLELQGHHVSTLYDKNATRANILTIPGEQIAPKAYRK